MRKTLRVAVARLLYRKNEQRIAFTVIASPRAVGEPKYKTCGKKFDKFRCFHLKGRFRQQPIIRTSR